jgi:hypothetical protein
MKNAVKAVIIKGEKTFNGDKVLTLQLDGPNWEAVKHFIKKRKLVPGSIIQLQIKDKESKSAKQNRTFHLLLQIYMKYLVYSGQTIQEKELKDRIKENYGINEYSLISFSEYDEKHASKAISGLIDEMLSVFNEADYYDKRFDEMIQEFNSAPVEPDEEMELF